MLSRICRLPYFPLLLAAVLASGCSASSMAERPSIQWPKPPLQARIEWVKEIHDEQDVGIRKSLWGRFVSALAGQSTTGMVKSYGVYATGGKVIAVADTGQSRVHVFDYGRQRYETLAHFDAEHLETPIGVTGDGDTTLFFTDSTIGAILRCDVEKLKVKRFAQMELGRPTGIAFSRHHHRVYVTDTAMHQVVAFDLEGKERFRIGRRGTDPGTFNFPTDLFVARDGRLYVTDALNSRIQIFSPDGKFLKMFGRAGDGSGFFTKPKGVAVDSDGNIYVVDALLDAVQIFNEDGELLLDFGENGTAPGQFWMPSGIYIDDTDLIYVSDSYNRRIQVFRYLKDEGNPGGKLPDDDSIVPSEPEVRRGTKQ